MIRMKKWFLLIVAVTLVFGAYHFYTVSLRSAVDPLSKENIVFDIRSGTTAQALADQLEERGLIRSATVFRFYMEREGLAEKIKTGRVVLSPRLTLAEIAEAVTSGKTQQLSVTLLEGWTARQMGEKLEELGLTTADEFMNCVKTCSFPEFDFLPLPAGRQAKKSLEGYLYPDTYFTDPANFSIRGFIKRQLQTFRNRLDDDWGAIQKSQRTLQQIVIMASIVEREERDPAERPRIADILWKRADANRGLDADATILYALGRTSGGLSYEDLQVNSLYNTRKYRGLPPGPISNPSVSSLRAALHAESTPYWYYLHDSDGNVHYGKTLDEHNENKARYIR